MRPGVHSKVKNSWRRERNERLHLSNFAIILPAFSRFSHILFTFYFAGLIHALFNCSKYTFHENSTKGRGWEESRWLCQNSSEGDLVSIEEENERIFVESIIKNLKTLKYFIGLRKEQLSGKWKWLTNGKPVDASQGIHPWAPGEPTQESGQKCATIYGNYRRYLGQFDDLPCFQRLKDTGYICEKAVSCTHDEKGRSL